VLPDVGFQASKTASMGQMMVVDIPRAQFSERWSELRGRLVDVLTNKNKGGKYSLQILALDGPAHTQELVQIAKDLAQDGVDTHLLAVGYINKGTPNIELRFITSGNL
jgi:hypothetical protein